LDVPAAALKIPPTPGSTLTLNKLRPMLQPSTPRRPVLLDDEPSSADELGAHERIANALAGLILTSPTGKSVCIDGDWGSGKSTIIKLLRQKLSNAGGQATSPSESGQGTLPGRIALNGSNDAPPAVHFFTYDAWVHSGDSLRREFLSSLIDGIFAETDWLDSDSRPTSKKRWEEKKLELARSMRRVEKETGLTFSLLGRMSAVLSVSWLAASTLLPKFDAHVESMDVTDKAAWLVIALLATGALSQVTAALWQSNGGFSIAGVIDKVGALFVNKGVSKETVSTVETPEPNSVQFQDTFGEYVSEALKSGERRLVMVVDNLDRVDADQQRAIWALLSSFVDNPFLSRNPWSKKVWVLVPLARERSLDAISKDGKASDFFDKIFQVTFRVPPPVLSGWKDMLFALLGTAFAGESEDERHDIIRVYESSLELDRLPTPRSLKLFVNELVVLSLQWDTTFPLTHLAAYAAQARMPDVLQALRLNTIPTKDSERLLNTQLRPTFAALFFNVADTKKANYLLLHPRLSSLLETENGKSLKEEFDADITVADVLDTIVIRELPTWTNEPSKFFRTAVAFAQIFDQPESPRDNLRATRAVHLTSLSKHLVKSAHVLFETLHPKALFDEKATFGITALLSIAPQDPRIPRAIMSLLSMLVGKDDVTSNAAGRIEDGLSSANVLANLDALYSVASIPAVREHLEARPEPIRLPLIENDWQRFCLHFEYEDQQWITLVFESRKGRADNVAYTCGRIQQNEFIEDDAASLRREIAMSGQEVLDEPFALLMSTSHLGIPESKLQGFFSCLRFLGEYLWGSGEYESLLSGLARNGVLIRPLAPSVEMPQWLSPYCIWLLVWTVDTLPPTANDESRAMALAHAIGGVSMDKELLEELVSEIVLHDAVDKFVKAAERGCIPRALAQTVLEHEQLRDGIYLYFSRTPDPIAAWESFHARIYGTQLVSEEVRADYASWLTSGAASLSTGT
jgi:energy-coupling factor transporter ATP-binding protein EcfA2